MTARAQLSGLVAGLLLLAQPSAAQDAATSAVTPAENRPPLIAVLPPRASPVFRTVDGGVREWWMAELAAASARVVSRIDVDAAVAASAGPERRALHGADAPGIAVRLGATHVFVTELRYARGEAEVWMRAYGEKNDTPIAVGHAKGKLAKLGDLIAEASKPLRKAVGAGGAPEVARLAEFGSYERAGAALAAGRPADVIPLLADMRGRVADGLHAELARAANDPRLALAERSRLASATGDNDADWLQVRQGLIEGKDAELLMAGAANAEARGEHARALELHQRAAEIAPEDSRPRIGAARSLSSLDRHAEARTAWEAVLVSDPDNLEAHEALSRSAALSPEVRAQRTLALAERKAERLDADGARKGFEQAALLAPKSRADARLGAARMQARLGNHDEALLAYEELGAEGADALGGAAADAYAGLGEARAIAGDEAGAAQAYAVALGKNPDHGDALQGQGELLIEMGKPAEAVAPLARAVQLETADGPRRSKLAQALEASGDHAGALAVLQQADAVPLEDQPGLLIQAAEIQQAKGDLEGAQISLQKAVSIEPDDAPLRSALAKAYAESGDAEAAAREQARVSALTGITATSGELLATDAKPGLEAKSQFAPLAATFPRQRADQRAFAGVMFLGIARTPTAIERVRDWVLPKFFDVRLLEADVAAGLGGRYALVPPRDVPELLGPSYERVLGFSTERVDLSLVNDALEVEVSFAARIVAAEPTAIDSPLTPKLLLEMRMHRGRTSDDIEILAGASTVPNPEKYLRWNPRALLPYGFLLALCLAPVIRGWGRLVVRLDYESRKNAKGFFTIEITRQPGKAKRESDKAGVSKVAKYQKQANNWSRFKRNMVQHENVFRLIPARDYYVCVHGIMQDERGEVVGNYLEERKVRVLRGKPLEVAFDFRPKEAALEVRLARPEGDTTGVARVALRGVASSLKYVKDDHTVYYVGRGKHVVVVGYGDCVYERSISVESLSSHQVTVALEDPQQAVFQGAKEAIEPFLMGDLSACARALDKAGMPQKANELRAKYHEQQGDKAEASRFYREAGQLTQAAVLSAESGGGARSAELYEQAGDHRSAAAGYLAAGEFLKAAQAFEKAYDWNEAIDAYRRAGGKAKVLELLERTGRHYEAGVAALDLGDEDRAIRSLQQVDLRDPDYAEACRALADLFTKREEWELAIDRFRAAIQAGGEDAASLELFEQLGDAFEKSGDLPEALQAFETIRKRDYQYAGVNERIRALRERTQAVALERQSQLNTAAVNAATQPAGALTAPTAPAEDRYEILGELGRGGMGIVYKARDRRLGRVVALKRLPDNLRDHPTAVALFLREAQSAAALNHPNIVTVYDADQANGHYYLTMEFLEGMPLDAILKKRGKLAPRDAVRMAVQISTGLQFAHERGIVHRDIKTANLFFTRDRVVKIMDFGLAKMIEEVRKAATVIGGTPYYMAPEQGLGERVDHRADLYAFGVTLFELLAGRVPFMDGDVAYHHRHTPAPDLSEFVAGVPADLTALIVKLMGKKPEDRPATTAEVTAALDALMKSGL